MRGELEVFFKYMSASGYPTLSEIKSLIYDLSDTSQYSRVYKGFSEVVTSLEGNQAVLI